MKNYLVKIIISLCLSASITSSLSFAGLSPVKYSLECRSDLLEAALDSAIAQIGTLEATGRNDGEVVKYLASVGLAKGNPYCAAGVYYCFLTAAFDLKLPPKEIPIPRTGLANAFYDRARKSGRLESYLPEVGDLIVWRKGRSAFGHVEWIVSVGDRGWTETVGFNTSKTVDGKKIYGVFRHKRNVFRPLGRLYIRGLVGLRERSARW